MRTRAREESEQANARGRRSTRLSSREKGDRREAESIWSGVVVLRDTERAPGIPDAARDSWYWCGATAKPRRLHSESGVAEGVCVERGSSSSIAMRERGGVEGRGCRGMRGNLYREDINPHRPQDKSKTTRENRRNFDLVVSVERSLCERLETLESVTFHNKSPEHEA